jgi:large subunit ribosomal protein L3
VPGSKNGWVFLSDAVKKAVPEDAPFPAGLLSEIVEEESAVVEEAPAVEAAPEAPIIEAAEAEVLAEVDSADDEKKDA